VTPTTKKNPTRVKPLKTLHKKLKKKKQHKFFLKNLRVSNVKNKPRLPSGIQEKKTQKKKEKEKKIALGYSALIK